MSVYAFVCMRPLVSDTDEDEEKKTNKVSESETKRV